MRAFVLVVAGFSLAAVWACTKSEMKGGQKPSAARNAAEALGGPDGPVGGDQCKVDCTDLDAQACADKKKKEQCDNSYRDVDCDGKSSKSCTKLVDEDRKKDGENGSEIMVSKCREDDDGKRCDKIEDEPKTTVVSRSGEGDGGDGGKGDPVDCSDLSKKGCDQKKADEGSDDSFRTVDCAGKTTEECQSIVDSAQGVEDGDQVKVENCPDQDGFCDELDAQDDTDVVSRDKDGGLEETDDSISAGLVKWCAGGPANAVYPFKDESDARDCMESIKNPSSVNGSGSCATDARVGRCSFKGSVSDRKKKVRKTVPGNCICLTSSIAAQAGITWDGAPGQ